MNFSAASRLKTRRSWRWFDFFKGVFLKIIKLTPLEHKKPPFFVVVDNIEAIVPNRAVSPSLGCSVRGISGKEDSVTESADEVLRLMAFGPFFPPLADK
jgi:hypothetical protein